MTHYETKVSHLPGVRGSENYFRVGIELVDAQDQVVRGPVILRDYSDRQNLLACAGFETAIIATGALLHIRQTAADMIRPFTN